jgi:hypothetical protein
VVYETPLSRGPERVGRSRRGRDFPGPGAARIACNVQRGRSEWCSVQAWGNGAQDARLNAG